MSAKDAEVTEEDRRAARAVLPLVAWAHPRIAQTIANARRDAYRAGQIAGLEEGLNALESSPVYASRSRLQARIRELKGET